jgi:hypothetical protein
MRSTFISTIALIGLIALAAVSRGSTIFQDDFESATATNTWLNASADADPSAVSAGGSTWTTIETEDYNFQVQNQPASHSSPNPAFNTNFGQQYLHTYWANGTSANNDGNHAPTREAVVAFSGADQAEMIGAGKVSVDVQQYNATLDGYNGSLSIIGWDNSAGVHTSGRVFDIVFKQDNSVTYWDGTEHTIAGLTMPHNAWTNVNITADFGAQTFSITVGANTVSGLALSGSTNKIQSLEFGTGPELVLSRGGWDNVVVTAVPEPASASVVLLCVSGAALLKPRRARRAH